MMTDLETYALSLLAEECGKIIQLIGKAGQFGLDYPLSSGDSPRIMLPKEIGDVLAAVSYACHRGLFDATDIEQYRQLKLNKLLDERSRDNWGRRLAP